MKKLSLLFIAFVFVLTSCSGDDNGSSDTNGDIVGTWIGQDVDYSGTTVTEIPGADNLVSTFVGEAYDVDYTLTFTENPNELVSEGSYSVELTTTVLGQTQVDNVENLEFLSDGEWSKAGDQLTIISDGESSTGTILELTATSLIVEINQTQDVSQQGFTINTTVNAITTFTRM